MEESRPKMTILMTKELLQQLDTCSGYTRVFVRLFPTSTYPDGVDVTGDVCAEHHGDFDWSWAVSVMLNDEGQDEHRRLTSSTDANGVRAALTAEENEANEQRRTALTEWRRKYNQDSDYPDLDASVEARTAHRELTDRYEAAASERRTREAQHVARVFGELFARPELRSSKIVNAHQAVLAQQERRDRTAYTQAQDLVTEAKTQLSYWTARLPQVEEDLVKARARYAPRLVEHAKRHAETRAEALAVAQRELDAAQEAILQAERDAAEAQASVATGASTTTAAD